MKHLFILLSLFLISCASNPVDRDINPEFLPYVMNYIENQNSNSTPEIVTGKEMSIQFDESNYAPSYAAYCKMSPDINQRKIFINKVLWEKAKTINKQSEYLSSVIGTCGQKGNQSHDFGDKFVRALNYLY